MYISVTRRVRFSAARKLTIAGSSESDNATLFGAKSRLHGHNFTLDVTVSGPAQADTGMVVDLKDLKRILEQQVVQALDHTDLTTSALLAGSVATSECLVLAIWAELKQHLRQPLRLHQVTLRESAERCYTTRGE